VTERASSPGAAEAGADLSSWLEEARGWAEDQLRAALASLDARPPRLAEALEYALFGGGKRLRPALVRLACEGLGGAPEAAAAPAAAVELIHTYSLVHDDLPCMDDDDLRRGRPTCHKVYDEATATLVGDGLLTGAFEVLARDGGERAGQMVAVLARAAGVAGMVAGQALDMQGSGAAAGRDEVHAIHDLKTAAMFAASAELGALAAGASAAHRASMREFGRALGLLFQAVDDLLDVTGAAEELGKTPGKDAREDKPTLVAAVGLEGARRAAEELAARAISCSSDASTDPRFGALVRAVLDRDR